MKTPILQTFQICKKYKDFKALDDLTMTIYEGDIYGFVGENGAGKTTLIRIITGLTFPTSGSYTLFGLQSNDKKLEEEKKKLSAIVESVSLNKGLTALENLKLQCKLLGTSKTDLELEDYIKDVGLDPKDIKNKKAGTFSLGMRQRLGLAIALVSNPKFILLDEPMNGLDPQGFVDMREAILSLNKKGVTFLISSHILSELDKVCTRVGFISHGHLLKELDIEELHDKERRKISIKSQNPEELLGILEKSLKLKEMKINKDILYIYDPIDINDLLEFIVKNKIHIESISVIEETIEDFYKEIMEGARK